MPDDAVPAPARSARIQTHPDLLSAEVNREVLLMSIEHGRYFGLDEVGSDVWRRLSGSLTVGELIDALTTDYEGDPPMIERDTLTFLAQLQQQGLVMLES